MKFLFVCLADMMYVSHAGTISETKFTNKINNKNQLFKLKGVIMRFRFI